MNDEIDFGADFGDDDGSSEYSGELEPINPEAAYGNEQNSAYNFGDMNSGSTVNGNDMSQNESQGVNTKRTMIIIIAVGVVILAVLFFLYSILYGSRHKNNDGGTGQTEVRTPVQTEQAGETGQAPVEPVEQTGNVEQPAVENEQPVVETTDYANGWVEIDRDTLTNVSEQIDGFFTVTDIRVFAKVDKDTNSKYLRGVLFGNITGLKGNYELVIPVSRLSAVTVGDVLNIKYTTIDIEGEKIVVDIR